MMPKPWVGGGWVRADQGSQGRKEHAPETPHYSSPTTRTEKREAGPILRRQCPSQELVTPLHPPPLLGLECSSFQAALHRDQIDTVDPGQTLGIQDTETVHSRFSGGSSWEPLPADEEQRAHTVGAIWLKKP